MHRRVRAIDAAEVEMARTFSREEFYELVWTRPLTKLAKEFNLSDVALHKVCKKHGIPHPPAGWWAKQQAGHDVKRIPLPKDSRAAAQITIAAGILGDEPAWLSEAREAARLNASFSNDADQGPETSIIKQTIADLRRCQPDDSGLCEAQANSIACKVGKASIDRVHLILTKLETAASHQGMRFTKIGGRVVLKGDGEAIFFSIIEGTVKVKYEPTRAEQAALEDYERRKKKVRSMDDYFSLPPSPQIPHWVLQPNGSLSFNMESVYLADVKSLRATFRDAKVQRLENVVSDIAVAVALLAAAKARRRQIDEERARQEEEARILRERAARTAHVEARRVEASTVLLSTLQELDRLRTLVVRLNDIPAGTHPRVTELQRWAAGQLAKLEASLSPAALEKRFDEQRLFGDDDDHAYGKLTWSAALGWQPSR